MNATVVKLNSLPDSYRPATDDHCFLLCQGLSLIFLLISAVEIRGLGIKFGSAGIYHLIHRQDMPLVASLSYLLRQPVGQGSHLLIGKTQPLRLPQKLRYQWFGKKPPLHAHNIMELIHETGVYTGDLAKLSRRGFSAQC